MIKNVFLLLIPLFLILFACKVSGKEPVVAGSFYPADKESLQKILQEFLSKVTRVKSPERIIALVSPHAGYIYSGQVAASGYKQLEGKDINKVILIGPSHHKGFNGASVYTKGFFKTPLGDVRINEKLAEDLLNEEADVKFFPEAFEKEHSLEVQLPFLQTVLKDFTIIPILVGSPSRKTFSHLTSKISEILDEKTIIIASTDLSHYHNYEKAKEMDSKVISAIERLSLKDAENLLKTGEGEFCGGYSLIIALEAARMAGANIGATFKYANSGDVTGDKERVVGYASIGLFKEPLTDEEKKELIALARDAIREYVTKNQIIDKEIKNPKFKTDGAVFVTIKEKGQLRGCIGHIQPYMPLYKSVIENAISAATEDPRFMPITKDELKDLDIEITILSPLLPVRNVNNIIIGKHGLVIRKYNHSGILLPQVPVEFGWDRETFLKQICYKAGLPSDSWKDAELYYFTAEIIH